VKQVPPDFLNKSAQETAARGSFLLVKDVAIRQLAQGAVKVPLGEVRRVAPPGLFIESDKGDHQLISLPLKDILRRIRPENYERRPNQQRVDVPESVATSSTRGQMLSAVRILRKEDLRKSTTPAPELSPSPCCTGQPRRPTEKVLPHRRCRKRQRPSQPLGPESRQAAPSPSPKP